MQTVRIISNRTSLTKKYIIESGFTAHEESLSAISNRSVQEKYSFTVIETENPSDIPPALLTNADRILIVCDKTSSNDKKFLISKGVSHVLLTKDHSLSGEYLRLILHKEKEENGRIMILDNINSYRRIIESIFTRFGYGTMAVESHEQIFENLNKADLQFILINLACPNLDVNGLVREAYKNPEIKKIPVIIYKDISEGLFVHEVIAGLNRLTKFILTPEELFSFFAELLSRKALTPLITRLNQDSEYKEYAQCSDMPLKQMYFCYEKMIFSRESLLETESLENLFDASEKLRDITLKGLGISWLKNVNTKEKVNTCGAGG